MLNVVLVGAGSHSSLHHAPSLQRFAAEQPGRVRLAAVCDLDAARAERARERFGFERSVTALGDLFDSAPVDAAVLVLQPPAMLPVMEQFAERRIPMMIEKPLGRDLAEAKAIAASARSAGSPVVVSFNRRFDPGLRLAMDWIGDQRAISYLRGSMLRVNRVEPGFVWGTGIHLLDAMVSVAGPLALTEAGAPPLQGRGGCWRVATLTGQNNLRAAFEILPSTGRVEERLCLSGDDYCVDVWTGFNRPWLVEAYERGKQVLREEAPADTPEFLRSGAYGETVAFLESLLEGRPQPGPSPDDAMVSTALAAAVQAG